MCNVSRVSCHPDSVRSGHGSLIGSSVSAFQTVRLASSGVHLARDRSNDATARRRRAWTLRVVPDFPMSAADIDHRRKRMTEKMEKKIIAVVGATGAQGGGLVRAILADPAGPFTARALTRNPDSARARELAAQGVEVVEADLDDEGSLRQAFDGAYGAFVVTNFWAQRTPEEEKARTRAEMELAQAAAAARAAKETGLRHVVWSTLEDTRPHFERLGSDVPTAFDGYKVPHFDAKGEANAFFTELGVPTTFLQTTMYYEAFLIGQGPHRDETGQLVLRLPMAGNTLALIAAADIGKTALGVFRRGD